MSSSITVKEDGTVEVDDESAASVVSTELVKASSETLAVELRRAREYRRHARAKKTETAYEVAWKRFQAWADVRALPILPASLEVIEAYVGWLADEGYSLSTIGGFLSAGAFYHHAAGLNFPRNAPDLEATLKGIRKQRARAGVRPVKKAPLGLSLLSGVCARLENADESLRSRALLTIGWFCMLRSANLVAIRRKHVRLVRIVGYHEYVDDDEEPNGLILHLPFSKTDQIGEGRDIATHAQPDESVCPVRAVYDYFAATHFEPEDLIFPISARTVSRLIKRLVADPAHGHKSLREITQCASCASMVSHFASHSLRRGSATGLALAGVSEREIMRRGGWKNERVMRGYVDDALLFENNPTKGLARK